VTVQELALTAIDHRRRLEQGHHALDFADMLAVDQSRSRSCGSRAGERFVCSVMEMLLMPA
jgi:hypothetical protein